MTARQWMRQHRREVDAAVASLEAQVEMLERWGCILAERLPAGARLLAAGNGGSAAEAQHLTGELVGRFLDERCPFAAVSLCSDSATLTAVVNDYGRDEMFARQVEGHGRPGDVLVLLSTSGHSSNVLAAAERGRRCGLTVWGLTGPAPNPLAAACDDALTVDAPTTAAVQEGHLVAVHALCAVLDAHLTRPMRPRSQVAVRA
jgi:phosphoheptose isomerase